MQVLDSASSPRFYKPRGWVVSLSAGQMLPNVDRLAPALPLWGLVCLIARASGWNSEIHPLVAGRGNIEMTGDRHHGCYNPKLDTLSIRRKATIYRLITGHCGVCTRLMMLLCGGQSTVSVWDCKLQPTAGLPWLLCRPATDLARRKSCGDLLWGKLTELIWSQVLFSLLVIRLHIQLAQIQYIHNHSYNQRL
jgi:hypothetical protein